MDGNFKMSLVLVINLFYLMLFLYFSAKFTFEINHLILQLTGHHIGVTLNL